MKIQDTLDVFAPRVDQTLQGVMGEKADFDIVFNQQNHAEMMPALCACWAELSIPRVPALPGKWDGEGMLENLEFGEEAPVNKMGDSRHFYTESKTPLASSAVQNF